MQPWPRCWVAFSWALLFIYSDTLLQRRAAPAAGHAHRTRSNVIAHLRRLGYAMRPKRAERGTREEETGDRRQGHRQAEYVAS